VILVGRRPGARYVLVVVTACCCTTTGAWAGSVNGTWKGRLLDPQLTGPDVPRPERAPIRDFPIATLVLGSAKAELRSEGVTMATHDSPSAVSSCTMRFRFATLQDGWRVYRQAGHAQLGGSVSGGAPALSACAGVGTRGGALRVHAAGAKLKVEFVGLYQPAEGAENWKGWPLRGYLTR
jgi:hypothetical protein